MHKSLTNSIEIWRTKIYTARIQVQNTSDEITARNVIATVKGTDLAEEVVLVGGHLDSWDLATGALDNGIGSFTITDIARTFRKLNLAPRRTVRFVLFMGEEEGLLGSTDYVEYLKSTGEIENIRYEFKQKHYDRVFRSNASKWDQTADSWTVNLPLIAFG